MKKFKKLEEYSDDELIIIVHDDKEDWQKEAVDYAKHLLIQRGISDDFAQSRIKEIRQEIDILWKRELEERKQESFSILELILMTLFWFRYILWNWYLNREGFTKKRKQRLYAIGGGMLLYLIFILNAVLSFDKMEEQRIQEINEIAKLDSIAKSKIDWSGIYIFLDTTEGQKKKTIWELKVQKNNLEHTAKLKLLDNNKTLTIDCVGLIKKDDFEFYPDTTYLLFNGVTISYYDRLFTFVKDSNEIFTIWGKMRPFYHPKYNGIGLFKDATAANSQYRK